MASLNLKTRKLNYTKADETLIASALELVTEIGEFDTEAKQDATTAAVALSHVQKHVAGQRNGKATEAK